MIVPIPQSVTVTGESAFFKLNADTQISDSGHGGIAGELNAFVDRAFGFRLQAAPGGAVAFELDESLRAGLGAEGYTIDVTADSVRLRAADPNGLFYAAQSFKQLIAGGMGRGFARIPAVAIWDKPRYAHRGYMLDVSRHFFPPEEIFRVADLLALHKMNVLHLHLTDDQGWRIQIDQYPELTSAGARRAQTVQDGKPHGGYYSKDDIRSIVSYCADRFITVIPEIDIPGHTTAAIAAYPHLSCREQPMEVAEFFGIKPDILCAGKESTYRFVFDVLDEVSELFPGPYVHLGGDEAPKVRWQECPHCQKAIMENGLTGTEQLQGWFINRAADYLKSKGKRAICWNESLYSGTLDESVICHYWRDGKDASRVNAALNGGRPAIVSKFTPYYLDYPFAMHSLKAVYKFSPALEGVREDAAILGVEAPLWTEYVADRARMDYLTYPRLAAVCETAWSAGDRREYSGFVKRLPGYFRLLDIHHVQYAGLQDANPGFFRGIGQMLDFYGRVKPLNGANRKNIAQTAKMIREMNANQRKLTKP